MKVKDFWVGVDFLVTAETKEEAEAVVTKYLPDPDESETSPWLATWVFAKTRVVKE